jgi:hypothetical protein
MLLRLSVANYFLMPIGLATNDMNSICLLCELVKRFILDVIIAFVD